MLVRGVRQTKIQTQVLKTEVRWFCMQICFRILCGLMRAPSWIPACYQEAALDPRFSPCWTTCCHLSHHSLPPNTESKQTDRQANGGHRGGWAGPSSPPQEFFFKMQHLVKTWVLGELSRHERPLSSVFTKDMRMPASKSFCHTTRNNNVKFRQMCLKRGWIHLRAKYFIVTKNTNVCPFFCVPLGAVLEVKLGLFRLHSAEGTPHPSSRFPREPSSNQIRFSLLHPLNWDVPNQPRMCLILSANTRADPMHFYAAVKLDYSFCAQHTRRARISSSCADPREAKSVA